MKFYQRFFEDDKKFDSDFKGSLSVVLHSIKLNVPSLLEILPDDFKLNSGIPSLKKMDTAPFSAELNVSTYSFSPSGRVYVEPTTREIYNEVEKTVQHLQSLILPSITKKYLPHGFLINKKLLDSIQKLGFKKESARMFGKNITSMKDLQTTLKNLRRIRF